ncbi:MAG: CHAT domain-containing protein [Blastocatellia bacterium]
MKIDATIKEHTLGLSCVEYGFNRERAITRPSLFKSWMSAYRVIVQKADPNPGLLTLGKSMYDYLDGDGGEMTELLERCDGPFVLELIGDPGSEPKASQFLEAPWELLANHRGFLAASFRAPLQPLRCVSSPELTPRPVAEALPLVFMAAQADADTLLRYEQEEYAILRAVANTPLDVIVEESGSLRYLCDRISQMEGEYLLHLSMHGRFDSAGRPVLVMETEVGGPDYISAAELAERLAGRHPHFLFLSACHSAVSRAATDSLVLALTRYGFPAVLGWNGTVEDGEATEFTSILYKRIASGDSIENAVLAARQTLLHKDMMSAFPSRNWHLARLYFGPNGKGAVMTSKGGGATQIGFRSRDRPSFFGKQRGEANERVCRVSA